MGKIWHFITNLIGNVFHHVVDALQKAYDALPENQKAALRNGSGIVDLINQSLTMDVDQLRQLIIQKFPEFNEQQLEAVLFSGAHAIGIAKPTENNLNDLIGEIQTKLKSITGTDWEKASHFMSVAASIAFEPKLNVGTVAMFIEWVYRTFFAKK